MLRNPTPSVCTDVDARTPERDRAPVRGESESPLSMIALYVQAQKRANRRALIAKVKRFAVHGFIVTVALLRGLGLYKFLDSISSVQSASAANPIAGFGGAR